MSLIPSFSTCAEICRSFYHNQIKLTAILAPKEWRNAAKCRLLAGGLCARPIGEEIGDVVIATVLLELLNSELIETNWGQAMDFLGFISTLFLQSGLL